MGGGGEHKGGDAQERYSFVCSNLQLVDDPR